MSLAKRLNEARTLGARQRLLDGVRHEGGVIENTSLKGCRLSGLRMTGLVMRNVDLCECACRAVVFPPMSGCSLRRADASDAFFPRIEKCQMQQAVLRRAVFAGWISHSVFDLADLRRARVWGFLPSDEYEFGHNRFIGSDMRNIDAAGARLTNTSFYQARLNNARLSRADLRGSLLAKADLSGANIIKVNLTGCVLRSARVEGSIMSSAQASVFTDRGALGMSKVQCRSRWIRSETIARLRDELKRSSEYRLACVFHHSKSGKNEKLLIWKDGRGAQGIGVFEARTRVPLRTYPTPRRDSQGAAMMDVAADYADWTVQRDSASVEGESQQKRRILMEAFIHALEAMFVVQ